MSASPAHREARERGWYEAARGIALAQVAAELGIERTRDGKLAPCPSCGEKTRSAHDERLGSVFLIHRETRWKCGRCEASGDVLDLVATVLCGTSCDAAAVPAVRAWFAARGWCEAEAPIPIRELLEERPVREPAPSSPVEAHPRKGRPTKCDAALIARMVLLVGQGCAPTLAAQLEGVGSSTFREWSRRAESEPDSVYAQLFAALQQAQSELDALARQAVIELLGHTNPRIRLQAAMFYLERRRLNEWGT